MLVTRGQGNNALLPTAGMGVKGGGPAAVFRNQWVRQWAIEQILANQVAEDKRRLEEELRENRKKIRQAPELEVVFSDDLPASGQEKEPARRQRRRRSGSRLTRAPRHDHSAASREVVAGLYQQQLLIKRQLANIEQQIQIAQETATQLLNVEPLRLRSPAEKQWAREQLAKTEPGWREMFTARVTDKHRLRKQQEDALAMLLVLAAA